MKQFIKLHKLLQEDHFRLKEQNCYRTIPCLGINDEEKVRAFLAHWPGAVLLIWGKCLIQSSTAGSLNLVICLNDLKGENDICSPPK